VASGASATGSNIKNFDRKQETLITPGKGHKKTPYI
jgi:hypothetical protein